MVIFYVLNLTALLLPRYPELYLRMEISRRPDGFLKLIATCGLI